MRFLLTSVRILAVAALIGGPLACDSAGDDDDDDSAQLPVDHYEGNDEGAGIWIRGGADGTIRNSLIYNNMIGLRY